MPQPPHCHRVLLAKHSLSSWPSSSQRCLQRRESVVLLHCLHFQALTFIDFTCSILSAILSLTSSSASFLCRFAALSSSTRWEKRDSCLRTVLPPPPLAANSASCFATRFPYCASIAFVSFAKSFVVFAAPCFFPAPPDSAATLAEMTGGALPGGIRRSLAAPPPPPPPPEVLASHREQTRRLALYAPTPGSVSKAGLGPGMVRHLDGPHGVSAAASHAALPPLPPGPSASEV
eukprot:CAMPEP_0178466556 /NCGR_PEP_ID=MMETSP0689_2-20121128/51966_1 /TAXON_ID=160604 /ORGANISM="Amphidinium massartii, Strain CS-259" /LENGTH=232 /DNA_ID=CAMNT_0020093587 /DNA_START=263 /DNA_END=962 /DNA_ORIENTATION=-